MAYFLFKCWHERLYSVAAEDFKPAEARVSIELKPITYENAHLAADLRGETYVDQFKTQLDLGDFGYYAYLDGMPVGYGWVKHSGSDDYFFKIGEGCVYLCRFFVHESARGNGIYPALITALAERERDAKTYYIAAERGNEASERGLMKVGFKFIREFGFIRVLKRTLNKKKLMANGK